MPVLQRSRPIPRGRSINTWLKDNGPVIGALADALVAVMAVLQLVVVGPMNRGFGDLRSDMNGRFDQQDKYIKARFDARDQRLGGLEVDVSELHTLSDRVSRNEGQINFLMERLQTVDAPSP